MKKILFGVIVILAFSVLAFAMPDFQLATVNPSNGKASVVIPSHAIELAPDVFDLGVVEQDGKEIQGYAFVHYKKEYHHNPGHGGGPPGGNGGSGGGETCFTHLAKSAKWKTTEDYVLDSTNNDGLTDVFVADRTVLGIEVWDSQVSFDTFGVRDTTQLVDGADTGSPDEKNELMFGSDNPNVIAVTIVWGIFGGPPGQRELLEWDMIFNDASFTFGDAGPTDEGNLGDQSVMDYQNIFTHEIGHAVGMGHPNSGCVEETMYGFAEEGETKKRTLNSGDIAGVQALYN